MYENQENKRASQILKVKSPTKQLSTQTSGTLSSDDDSGSAAFVDVGKIYSFENKKSDENKTIDI